MFVIIPTNKTIRRMVLLLLLMFILGVLLGHSALLLFLAPRLLGIFDLLGIPSALLGGWIVFRLVRQLPKSSMDDHGGGLFSSVGFSAWMIFLLVSCATVGGMWLGGLGAMDDKRNPPFGQRFTRRAPIVNTANANTAKGSAETGSAATGEHGTIFFGTATAAPTNSAHP